MLIFNRTLTLADAKVSRFFRLSKVRLPHDDIRLHTGSICHFATFMFLFRVQRYAVRFCYPSWFPPLAASGGAMSVTGGAPTVVSIVFKVYIPNRDNTQNLLVTASPLGRI